MLSIIYVFTVCRVAFQIMQLAQHYLRLHCLQGSFSNNAAFLCLSILIAYVLVSICLLALLFVFCFTTNRFFHASFVLQIFLRDIAFSEVETFGKFLYFFIWC